MSRRWIVLAASIATALLIGSSASQVVAQETDGAEVELLNAEVSGPGKLSVNDVKASMEESAASIESCFVRVARQSGDMSGEVTIRLSIVGSGDVRDARVVESSHKEVDQCLRDVAERRMFPAPEGGDVVAELQYRYQTDTMQRISAIRGSRNLSGETASSGAAGLGALAGDEDGGDADARADNLEVDVDVVSIRSDAAGGDDRERMRSTIEDNRSMIRVCLLLQARRHPETMPDDATFSLNLVVDAHGGVSSAEVSADSLPPRARRCIANQVRRMGFEAPSEATDETLDADVRFEYTVKSKQ